MSGARDSMTTGIRALPNGSGPAEKGLRLGLGKAVPPRGAAAVSPGFNGCDRFAAPLQPKPAMTPGSRHRVENRVEKRRPSPPAVRERRERAAGRAGRRTLRARLEPRRAVRSLPLRTPSQRARRYDRSHPTPPAFSGQKFANTRLCAPGAAARGSAERVGRLPTASGREPGRRLAFPLRLPYMPRHSTGGFYAAPDSRRRSGGEVPSLHMIRRGSTGQG